MLLWNDTRLWNDARTYQILFLALFLVVGLGTRDWTLQPGIIVVAIATCVTTQWVMVTISQRLAFSSQQPALIQNSKLKTQNFHPPSSILFKFPHVPPQRHLSTSTL
jgi:hypothetical protein